MLTFARYQRRNIKLLILIMIYVISSDANRWFKAKEQTTIFLALIFFSIIWPP
jgi:hypothetical protein